MNDRLDSPVQRAERAQKPVSARSNPPREAAATAPSRRDDVDRSPAGERQYSVHATDDWRSLVRWQADWERLADTAIESAPAAEHWMLLPSLRHLASRAQVRVVTVTVRRKGGDAASETLCGVFPIHLRPMPGLGSTIVEFWHHIYSVSAIPLVAEADAVGCVTAFVRWLRDEMPPSTLLRVPEARVHGGLHACLHQVISSENLDSAIESCWSRAYFRPSTDAETYLLSRGNAHHRKEWRRLERRLGETGALAYDELGADGDVDAWLRDFLSLEAAGWKGREGTAFVSEPAHAAWLREVGVEAFARKRLMMLSLGRSGVPIAIKLNVLAGSGGYAFKIAYDEGLEKFSPGVLLELENIRRLHRRANMAWMDSLAAPNHPMIERIWSGREAFVSMLVAPGRFAGRFVLAARPLLRLARTAVKAAAPWSRGR